MPGEARNGRAADAIVAEIEARIAAGDLRDDAPLPAERALMQEFGASRTVVREAITALSNRGLIECRPRHRPVVRRLRYQTLLDTAGPLIRQFLNAPGGVRNVFEARIFVERMLVRDAATGAGKEHIRALRTALEANRGAIPDSARFYVTDVEFHRVLYEIPGNPVFPAIQRGFVSWLAPQWERMAEMPDRNARNYQAHAAIFEAILARDPDAAEAALLAHLRLAWEHIRSTFDGVG